MEWIYLVLIGLVILFGIGVLVVSRRRAQRAIEAPSAPPAAPPTAPPQPGAATAVLEPEVVAPPATLRERMARARSTLAGAFVGIRGRRGITDETWDDLEEALLLADVGVGVTTDLLDGSADAGQGQGADRAGRADRGAAHGDEGPARRRRPQLALRAG